MAKTPMRCPFNQKLCEECQLFRGRHYYLSTCEHYRGYIKTDTKPDTMHPSQKMDFASLKKLFEPWSAVDDNVKPADMKIKIKVIDREAGTERYCDLLETKNWDWQNRFIMRLVNGKHVTSWEEFLEIVRYQDARGTAELVVYEAPSFMLA